MQADIRSHLKYSSSKIILNIVVRECKLKSLNPGSRQLFFVFFSKSEKLPSCNITAMDKKTVQVEQFVSRKCRNSRWQMRQRDAVSNWDHKEHVSAYGGRANNTMVSACKQNCNC